MSRSCRVIDGKKVAQPIVEDARRRVERLKAAGKVPHVVTLSASDDPALALYMKGQGKSFRAVGISYLQVSLPADSDHRRVAQALEDLNRDPAVTGIVIAVPLPEGVSARALRERIDPRKDIEGVSVRKLGAVLSGKKTCGPATAAAVMEVLRATGQELRGREAVVVGHSDIVGKPVALHLMEELATVTVCHIGTQDVAFHTRRADIVVMAVGKPRFLTVDMIRDGATVIDVGINQVPGDGGAPEVIGDVDFEAVRRRAAWITPVPGGVGPVTVAVLLRRAAEAAEAIFAPT